MQNILKTEPELDPLSLLFGLPNTHITTVPHTKLLNILTFCARKNITSVDLLLDPQNLWLV